MANIRIGVLIITYDRPQLFERCLISALEANKTQNFPIIVVYQRSKADYSAVLARNLEKINEVIEVDGSSRSVEENINYNRILGMEIIFNKMDCDFLIALEDDAIVKNSSFDFCLLVAEEFIEKSKFRGVNFGSRIRYAENLEFTYSKIRYGCHGPASMLSKQVWKRLNLNSFMVKSGKIAWDGWIEPYLKTGFMITPNISMYLDLGTSGTHTPDFQDDSYFEDLQKSFKDSVNKCSKIELVQLEHNWRSDAISYKRFQDLQYQFLYYLTQLKHRVFN